LIFKKVNNANNKLSFEQGFIEPNISTLKVTGYIANGYFIDIGIPEDYQKAQIEIETLFLSNRY
jgi:D-glycero-alpha-D-manno-heptose 1-phosphate guanylyltransferase